MDIIEPNKDLQKFNVTNAVLEQFKEQFLTLTISGLDDKSGYAKVKEARQIVRSKRIEVEKVRKELKEGALSYGRMVDAEAKRITSELEPIELHLEAEQTKIDDEKERLRDEARRKKQEKFDSRNQQLTKLGVTLDYLTLYEMSDGEFDSRLAMAQDEFDAEKRRLDAIEETRVAEEKRLAKLAAEQKAEALRLEELKALLDAREAKIKAAEKPIVVHEAAAPTALPTIKQTELAPVQDDVKPVVTAPKRKFRYRVFNFSTFVEGVAQGLASLDFLQINETALEKHIEQHGGEVVIPGIILEEIE